MDFSTFSKADDAKRKAENNNGAISTHNVSAGLKSTKYKEHPVVASKSNSSDLYKKKTVISNLNKVEARQFPGEKSAPKYHSKVKRSRSRSPIPQTSKSNGMRIESDRLVQIHNTLIDYKHSEYYCPWFESHSLF